MLFDKVKSIKRIASLIRETDLKHYFNDILEILNVFANLDNHYTKVKADCTELPAKTSKANGIFAGSPNAAKLK